MTPMEIKALGLRARAAGLVAQAGVVGIDSDGTRHVFSRPGAWWSDEWPDVSNPATRGVMLAQVRTRWGDVLAYCRSMTLQGRTRWCVYVLQRNGDRTERGPCLSPEGQMLLGDCEAGALVLALEAAPPGAHHG